MTDVTPIEVARNNCKKNRKKLSNNKYYKLHQEELILKSRKQVEISFNKKIETANFILNLIDNDILKNIIMDICYKYPNLTLKIITENIN